MEIDGGSHRVGGPLIGEVEVRHLAERVHAGIGPSRSRHANALAGKGHHGVLECSLDRRAVLLALPADERRAVVFDCELVAGHGVSSSRHVGKATTAGGARTVPAASVKPRKKASAD